MHFPGPIHKFSNFLMEVQDRLYDMFMVSYNMNLLNYIFIHSLLATLIGTFVFLQGSHRFTRPLNEARSRSI